jgi:hypothetical protein
MTMRKRGMLVWALISLGLPSWCADFWDGNAAILKGDARFESGVYAASNSFPTDTEIQVQNLENQRVVTAIVTQRIAGQSDILVFLSPKAGESIGMTQGRMNRVRVKVPMKTVIPTATLVEDRTESRDPDINPSAGMTQSANPTMASTAEQTITETPEHPSADAQPPAASPGEKAASELPAPASDTSPDVVSGPDTPQAKANAASTAPESTPAPAAPTESMEAPPHQKSTGKEQEKNLPSTATPEPPAKAASDQSPLETPFPPALEELLQRTPQKRLFLPPRGDEMFAYRKPVPLPEQTEPKVTQAPAKEPAKEPAIEPAKEPVKTVEIPPVKELEKQPAKEPATAATQEPRGTQAAETPMASEIPAPSATGSVLDGAKIAEAPVPPPDSYEVGDGEELPRGGAEPQHPGHEPVAVAEAEQTQTVDTGSSEVSETSPENPVWTPYVADLEPTEPKPPVEEVAPDTAVVIQEEAGPETPGVASSKDPALDGSGMPTGISETPRVASAVPPETAPELRPMGSEKSTAAAAKPVDQPKEPAVANAAKTAESAPEIAAAAKPVDTVVTMEPTAEKPPAETVKPVEKAAPDKAAEKPVVAAKPSTVLPLKSGTLKAGEFYLQLAAYATESIAQETIKSLAATYPVGVLPPAEKGKPLYRVVVGPLNRAESGTLLNWFRFRGFPDAFLKTGE